MADMKLICTLIVSAACAVGGFASAATLDLNGSWAFAFEEGRSIAQSAGAAFMATDRMVVPGCFDMTPKWLCKRGTALYRRTFTLDAAVSNAWLVVDGMGLVGRFEIDGRDLGTHPYPYAKLELETGPLAAGTHTVFAALDNRFDWNTLHLARPYYDFYCFGGFYHGVSLTFDNRRLFVRTRDYATGRVEVEAVGFATRDFAASLVFDGTNAVAATFKDGRATVTVPGFRLWSPETPNLHTVSLEGQGAAVTARFGIREIKAAQKRLWLNGRPLYLRGVNRHESHPQFGAATPDALMIEDIQNLKSLGGNFIRGCHYQQAQRFLDYCDEMGVLVWEESLGWGNGSHSSMAKYELTNETFIAEQIAQTKAMVRTSFNHPSVVIFAFMNEFASGSKPGKALADKLIAAIKAEDSGRLVTYACCHNGTDIANENTDLVSFNTYPGWIGSEAGTPDNLARLIRGTVSGVTARFRKLYPDKPIIVSEMGTCGVYGQHDPAGAQWTEEFQAEYNGDVIDAVFAHPDITGLTLWQFTDARSYHRDGSSIRSKPFAQNLAGLYDGFRRPKATVRVVKEKFARRAAIENLPAGTDAAPVLSLRLRGLHTATPEQWAATYKAIAANPGCCDEIWFSTGIGLPPLAWHREQAARIAQASADVRKLGITPSLQFQATLGHADDISAQEDCSAKDWTGFTGSTGVEAKLCSCPRQPKFLDYIRAVSRIYAANRPGSVWVDDDLRIVNHRPATVKSRPGCWCATCLAAFNRETGGTWTRETLDAALAKDAALRARWQTFSIEAIAAVARAIAEEFHRVSPTTRMALQHATGPTCMADVKAMLAALHDASGLPVRFRPGGGAYYDFSQPGLQIVKSLESVRFRKQLGNPSWVDVWCPEVETCPRAYGSRTAQSALVESFAAMAYGFEATSLLVMDTRFETDALYARTLLKPLADAAPVLTGYLRASAGSVPVGFAADKTPCSQLYAFAQTGVPVLPGVGTSLGELSQKETAFNVCTVGSQTVQTLRDRLDRTAGGAPATLASPFVGLLVPRVSSVDGTLATVALFNTRIDVQTDVAVRLRHVPAGAARVVWHALREAPVALPLVRDGDAVRVTIPEIKPWNAGYLSFM